MSKLDEAINTLRDRTYTELTSNSPTWEQSSPPNNGSLTVTTKATWCGTGDWTNYRNYTRLMNGNVGALSWVTNNNWGGRADLIASITNTVDTTRWMTQLWPFLGNMPANQLIIPGTHDSLAGGYASIAPQGSQTTKQDTTFPFQLESGCRYFDLRFDSRGYIVQIKDFYGYHSSFSFNVQVSDILNGLKDFYNDGRLELIVISLCLTSLGNPAGVSRYDDFINEMNDTVFPDGRTLRDLVIPSDDASKSIATLMAGNKRIILLIDISDTDYPSGRSSYYWKKMSYDTAETDSFGTINSPQQWYTAQLDNNYTTRVRPTNQFSYMSMTSTTPHGGFNQSPLQFAKESNGVLADWILYANPDSPDSLKPSPMLGILPQYQNVQNIADALSAQNGGKFVLPFVTGAQNHNLIAMDYFQLSPFIANAYTQNLIASKHFAPPEVAIELSLNVMSDSVGTQTFYYSQGAPFPTGYGNSTQAFNAYSIQYPGTVPIYRHMIKASDSNATEVFYLSKDRNPPPSFTYMGIAFYAYPNPVPGLIPIYLHIITATDSNRTLVYFYSKDILPPTNFNGASVAFYVRS
jgi:hypothetical protein